MTIKHTAGGTRYEQHGEPRMRVCEKCQRGYDPDDAVRHIVICGHRPTDREWDDFPPYVRNILDPGSNEQVR